MVLVSKGVVAVAAVGFSQRSKIASSTTAVRVLELRVELGRQRPNSMHGPHTALCTLVQGIHLEIQIL